MSNQEFITKTDIKKQRGWTNKLLSLFLPEPDEIRDNPLYRSAPKMQLFDLNKIIGIEESQEFKLEKNIAEKRKLYAKKAIDTKLYQIKSFVDGIEINIPIYKRSKLIKLACKSYNDFQDQKCLEYSDINMERANKNSDPAFLNRICVNYLRHNACDYDNYLNNINGKVGKFNAYTKIRNKIFEDIAIKYPFLKDECENQNWHLESDTVT